MTLGTAASSSTMNARGRWIERGQKSTRKMATLTPMGIAKSMAKAEVTSVPKIAGRTPKTLCTGSNARFVRKLKPNCWMVDHELISSTSATPATNASTMKTSSRVTPRNSRSLGRRPNLLVSQARLRCPAPPRARDTCCCMQSPLHIYF